MSLHKDYRLYLDRLRIQSSNTTDLSKIPQWLEKNTAHPTDAGKLWTFDGHEYQIDVVSDTAAQLCVQKCSQVGASELQLRLALALLYLLKKFTLIYVLPTAGIAKKFTKGRIDPVMQDSPTLSSAASSKNDSAEMKQIGQSFLYVSGTYGQQSAISVPAQGLFKDEVDFCNQEVLTTYNSRLGHAKEGEYFERLFSTPTVEGFGINKAYSSSSRGKYTVRCPHCLDQVSPNFMDFVEIPGYDGTLHTFDKEDLEDPRVDISKAFIRCDVCTNPIDAKHWLNPKERAWVHEAPNKLFRGYQVSPLDVPEINPIRRTLAQIQDYDRKKDWVNFKVGLPFSDAETSFLEGPIKEGSTFPSLSKPLDGETTVQAGNTVFGLDVGKTSWFTVLTLPGISGGRVIYAERIRQDGKNYLGTRVLQLMKNFGCVAGVVDAAPDFSVAAFLIDACPVGIVWANYYTRTAGRNLKNTQFDVESQVCKSYRTGCFDDLVKDVNSKRVTIGDGPEFKTILDHVKSMKRIDQKNNIGELVSYWTNTGDDHYAHSLLFATIAKKVACSEGLINNAVPCLPMVGKVKMKDMSSDQPAVSRYGFS